jgi:hypothetical protein
MKIKNLIPVLLIGIIIGWFLPHFNSCTNKNSLERGNSITIHDTLKVPTVQYKILPGADFNIDSLINVINQFWKDSLKNTYGHGLFESQFTKSDALGTRSYTLASRIPPDPASTLTVDESFVFPKHTLGIVAGINSGLIGKVGLKYYFFDHKYFSLTGSALGNYEFVKKTWTPNVQLELEIQY